MELESDIIERIQRDFSPEDAARAVESLVKAKKSGRIARCVIVAANGSLESLKQFIDVANFDYRDAILAGEYSKLGSHLRDLCASFLIDAPEKFWISSITRVLQGHGYELTSIETKPAIVRERQRYTSDLYDGVGHFSGPFGPIEITKHDGMWSLRINDNDLDLYNLDHPFDDQAAFDDAVSCYLFAKRNPIKPFSVRLTRAQP